MRYEVIFTQNPFSPSIVALLDKPKGGTLAAAGREPCVTFRNNLRRKIPLTHLISVQFHHAKVVYKADKIPRSLEYSGYFFIRNADEAQGVEERRAEEVVSVDLRAADFMPYSPLQVNPRGIRRHFPVDASGLIRTNVELSALRRKSVCRTSHLADIKYSPPGLQSIPRTGPW